ncbi:MAG: tRNA preQ1(34) S-adenosylmethionine ribosyltransferase-isomerase QueA [Clostridiales bacterium]|jgi:S-adenosylmethionine:tRNA ribosyltransferase-isomerase|nr:tRNA preQ1(34) S-adenosylmethionine ribosyltransferase-isomerase QueA [Clostridiales bacterium]
MLTKVDFFYDLPEELIGQIPLDKRDNSRLLVYDRLTKSIEHRHFFDIVDYFKSGDVLVLNNTRVLPALLKGKTENGKCVEVLLHKAVSADSVDKNSVSKIQEKSKKNFTVWEILVKNAKKFKCGQTVTFDNCLNGVFLQQRQNDNRLMQFEFQGDFESVLKKVGQTPLPHYIKAELKEKERYNTVYAKSRGDSVAAPTAGLHFTKDLIDRLASKGVQIAMVNLTVGLGTFRPVKTDKLADHTMHSEHFEMDNIAAQIINNAKFEGRRVIAVGTTSVRVLESSIDKFGKVIPQNSDTQIFIYPPFKFKIVDALITNFHLPESTLIMLVSAFIGHRQTMDLYRLAVSEKYKFFSFGDGMLIT